MVCAGGGLCLNGKAICKFIFNAFLMFIASAFYWRAHLCLHVLRLQWRAKKNEKHQNGSLYLSKERTKFSRSIQSSFHFQKRAHPDLQRQTIRFTTPFRRVGFLQGNICREMHIITKASPVLPRPNKH